MSPWTASSKPQGAHACCCSWLISVTTGSKSPFTAALGCVGSGSSWLGHQCRSTKWGIGHHQIHSQIASPWSTIYRHMSSVEGNAAKFKASSFSGHRRFIRPAENRGALWPLFLYYVKILAPWHKWSHWDVGTDRLTSSSQFLHWLIKHYKHDTVSDCANHNFFVE